MRQWDEFAAKVPINDDVHTFVTNHPDEFNIPFEQFLCKGDNFMQPLQKLKSAKIKLGDEELMIVRNLTAMPSMLHTNNKRQIEALKETNQTSVGYQIKNTVPSKKSKIFQQLSSSIEPPVIKSSSSSSSSYKVKSNPTSAAVENTVTIKQEVIDQTDDDDTESYYFTVDKPSDKAKTIMSSTSSKSTSSIVADVKLSSPSDIASSLTSPRRKRKIYVIDQTGDKDTETFYFAEDTQETNTIILDENYFSREMTTEEDNCVNLAFDQAAADSSFCVHTPVDHKRIDSLSIVRINQRGEYKGYLDGEVSFI